MYLEALRGGPRGQEEIRTLQTTAAQAPSADYECGPTQSF
jgi:hypothetical protein